MAALHLSLAADSDPIGARRAVLELLSSRAALEPRAIERAQAVSTKTRRPLELVLNQMGVVSDDDLAFAYAGCCGVEIWKPVEHPQDGTISEEIGISEEFLSRGRIALLDISDERLLVALCDPLDETLVRGLRFAARRAVEVQVARICDWEASARRHEVQPDTGGDERRLERDIEWVGDADAQGPGPRIVASAFRAAVAQGASDLHFEPRRNDLQIRLRVDGRLRELQAISSDEAGPVVSRIKVLAGLDVAEQRLPQDGRTTFIVSGKKVDVRVATSPTVFGEAAVLRLLDRSLTALDLGALGHNPEVEGVLKKAAQTPHGLFLITGPTGSGKTTTLYALLQTLKGSAKKILTVEDPVEFHFDHVTQTQVAPGIGLTFASALRSFLRQDPDVILVGEIRDEETAAVAVQAAMTGHLVIASIHANTAFDVGPRLMDLGVETYLIAAALRGAAAQRLVRRLCPTCRVQGEPSPAEQVFSARLCRPATTAFHPVGCTQCGGTGFTGRIPISEAFLTSNAYLKALSSSTDRVHANEGACSYTSMASDGLAKAEAGVTTIAEVIGAIDA